MTECSSLNPVLESLHKVVRSWRGAFGVLFLMLWLPFVSFGQVVQDVTFSVVDKQLVIGYSLTKNADIRVSVSVDNGKTYGAPLQNLSGDVGKGIKAGLDKKIIAYDLREIRGVDSLQLRFRVEVDDGSVEVSLFDTLVFKMLPVEGGTFKMGCTNPSGAKHNYEAEFPVHQVTVSSFYMGQYEVTQRLWKAVMGDNPSYWSDNDSLPVEQVSWNEVQVFVSRLSQLTGRRFRLPTEAEWEYAARGGSKSLGYVFPGTSGDLASYIWYGGNSASRTHPVGRKRPNELGLYDMGGNVWEWCLDWMAEYTADAQVDPRGPKHGENRILRGGSINSPSWGCTVSDRSWYLPDHGYRYHGFRLVMENDYIEQQ